MGTLHENQYKFLIISRLVVTRMRNVSDKLRENQNTHFMFNPLPPPQKKYTIYGIMWKNIV